MASSYADLSSKMITSREQTMTSLQIAEITGKIHANILRDIRTILEQGVNQINFELVEYTDAKGEKRPCYNLTKKGCLILASGYDAKLREKIIDRWEELELDKQQVPLSKAQRTLATIQQLCELAQRDVELEQRQIELEKEQKTIARKVSEIEETIRPNGFMSVMGFANTHHINIGTKAAAAIGRLASKWCKSRHEKTESVKHERWGEVNTYPMEALKVAFAEFYPAISF